MFPMRHSFLLIFISFAGLSAWPHGASISIIGDVKIVISEDKFICDKIECPANADHCVVSKKQDPKNSAHLVRSNACYSATHEVLKNSVSNETIDDNSQVKFHIVAHRNGLISSFVNTYGPNNFDVEKFNKEMTNFQQNLQAELDEVKRDLNNLGSELGNLFG